MKPPTDPLQQPQNPFLFPLPCAFLRRMGKITHKEFVEAVREAGVNDPDSPSVDYCQPGLFRVGERQIKIEMQGLQAFW